MQWRSFQTCSASSPREVSKILRKTTKISRESLKKSGCRQTETVQSLVQKDSKRKEWPTKGSLFMHRRWYDTTDAMCFEFFPPCYETVCNSMNMEIAFALWLSPRLWFGRQCLEKKHFPCILHDCSQGFYHIKKNDVRSHHTSTALSRWKCKAKGWTESRVLRAWRETPRATPKNTSCKFSSHSLPSLPVTSALFLNVGRNG